VFRKIDDNDDDEKKTKPLSVWLVGFCAKVNRTWDLGLPACLFWTGSDVFLSTTSIMHLCAIAIHRHLGIAYPLRMRRGAQNRRHVVYLLLPVWSVSAAVSVSLVVHRVLVVAVVVVVVVVVVVLVVVVVTWLAGGARSLQPTLCAGAAERR